MWFLDFSWKWMKRNKKCWQHFRVWNSTKQFFFGDRNHGIEKLPLDFLCVSHGLSSFPTHTPSFSAIKKSVLVMTKSLKNENKPKPKPLYGARVFGQIFQSRHNHAWLFELLKKLVAMTTQTCLAWRRRYLLIGVKIIDVMNVSRNQTGGGGCRGRHHGVRHRSRGENQWHC